MPKPLDQLAEIAAGVQGRQQLESDTLQAVDCAIRIRDQWLAHMAELSSLAHRSGMANILATAETIHPDAPTLIQSILAAAETFHTSMTDEPFPELPDEPVPPVEPDADLLDGVL